MVTASQLKALQKERDILKELGRHLTAVKNKRGFFPIVRLQRQGLIKKHVTKKGKMVQGQISGQKSHYVLTEKGKRILNGIMVYVK